MEPMDYAWRAATAWFLGFAPVAEIYVAVPAALAMGLDPVSVVAWAVAVTAKVLRLRRRALFGATFASILVYAVVLVVLIESGARLLSG